MFTVESVLINFHLWRGLIF